jgi:hypothetical protein
MVLLVNAAITSDDLEKAMEEYGDYIKVVTDVTFGRMTIGGEWHADGEKLLIEAGSKQVNLWGGGIDIMTGKIETIALINLRPDVNPSQDILNPEIRNKFITLVNEKFSQWIGKKH